MDLNETAAFVAVIREGSFTAAARALGVPKSTLSRQVSRLEERLGVRLMQRTTRKLHLTEAGTAYYERCAGAIHRIEEAEMFAHDLAGVPRGTLRISTPHGTRTIWNLLDLEGFLDAYPEVVLDLHEEQRAVDIIAEGFDVAIRGGSLPDSSLVARQLTRSTLFFAASPAYLEKHGRPETLEDLEDHPLLVFRPGVQVQTWRVEGPDGVTDWRPSAAVAVNEFGLLKDLAIAQRGIAMCQSVMSLSEFRDGQLERVLPEYALVRSALWIVYPSAELVPLKVRVFVDHVTAAAKLSLSPLFEEFFTHDGQLA